MVTQTEATRQRRELWRGIERDERAKVRETLAGLKAAVREARLRRGVALREAKAQCRADRLAARDRAQAARKRIAEEVRRGVEEEREAARDACARRLREAQTIRDEVARTRAQLAAEREASRAEQLLAHAEKNPEVVHAAIDHPAETELREAERAHAAAIREYEGKKVARVGRMRKRAAKLEAESQAAYSHARQISKMIPMGQPILVGHHSERRHRRDIGRIDRGFSKAFELRKEAKAMGRRADAAEDNRAISSDDPDAIRKLTEKLEALERHRAQMVRANRAIRSPNPHQNLSKLGFSSDAIVEMLAPDPMGRVGIPSYALQNASQEARRVRQRIEELKSRESRPAPEPVQLGNVRIEDAENRVRIVFPAKPDEAMRNALKRGGFHWSPTVGAWQRMASNQAWYQAKRILGEGP